MSKFRAPKFGTIGSMRAGGGRHTPESTPLRMPDDNAEDTAGGGRHRREGRHGIDRTRDQYRPAPTGAPAGQHRPGARPAPAGRHRAPEPPQDWVPTKADWRRLVSGATVNGYRLTRA